MLALLGAALLMAVLAGCAPSPVAAVDNDGVEDIAAGNIVYVQSSALNARSGPSTRAAVAETLPEGTELQVVERSGDWTRVAKGGDSFWVASRHVTRSKPAARSMALISMPKSAAAPANSRKKAKKKKKSRPASNGFYSGGSCSCGGGNVCIGPRGGRYCITSGGNKRYGV